MGRPSWHCSSITTKQPTHTGSLLTGDRASRHSNTGVDGMRSNGAGGVALGAGGQAGLCEFTGGPPPLTPPGQAQTLCVCIHRLHGTPGRGPNNTEDTAARELHIFPSEQPGNPFLNMPVGRLPPGVQCRSDGILVMSSGHVLLPPPPLQWPWEDLCFIQIETM